MPPLSDWSKVTRPIPVPNEWTKPFWDAARRGVVELQRCQSCGHFQHPPYATCTRCVATDLKFEPVRGSGTIYAYTIMYHTGDKRFAAAVPYASIIVELDDAPGALLAANLLEAPYTEAKVGRRVEVVFEKLNDDITLPQFRLARTPSAEPHPSRPRTRGRVGWGADAHATRRAREIPNVGEPMQGGGQRRRLFQSHPLGRDPARGPCARRGQGGGRRFRGSRCPISTAWQPTRNCRRPATPRSTASRSSRSTA